MGKLLIKMLLIALLALTCNFAINKLFLDKVLPPIRGDKQLLGKYNTLVQNVGDFNILFIGSSKIHYHINSQVFDSVVNARSGQRIKSYNFGIDGMLPMESFKVCQTLLNLPNSKLRTVVFELVFPKTNDTHNIFTYRGFYWVDAAGYRNYVSALLGSGLATPTKLKNLGFISFMRAENLLNLGKLNEYIDYRDNPGYKDPDQHQAGFEGLQTNKLTLADEALVDATQAASLQAFENFDAWSTQPVNKAYLEQINKLTKLASQRNVHIIYIMPVLWGYTWQYKELFPIYHHLSKYNKLLLANANAYPYHFNKNQLFDAIHLNKTQANVYTKAIADTFVKKGLIK